MTPDFEKNELIPAVVQDARTGQVRMLGYMNREAFERTASTGELHLFSRSRGRLWRKGERSGQTQRLVELRVDCDGDALLLRVDQHGVACHTGRRSCFYRAAGEVGLIETMAPAVDQKTLYGEG